jgi:Tol biopolymer transport system component
MRPIACIAVLITLCSCSRQPAQPSPDSPAASGIAGKIKQAMQAVTLDENERKALELYQRWAGFRENLQKLLMDNGQLKLMLTREQASRDFADPMGGGVMPTTKEGMDIFKEQFDKAHAAEKEVRAEAAKIFAEIRNQPAEVREVFWSLMSVHGIQRPKLTRDGSKVVFIQSSYGSSSSVFEQEAVPLDPADTNPGDDVYVWDLATGNIDCVSIDPNSWQKLMPVASADGSVIAFLSVPTGENKGERNLTVRNPDGTPAAILTDGPFGIENFADKPVPKQYRMIHPPSITADGSRLVFPCGTYENRQREDGYIFQNYYLVLWDRALGKARSLTQPVDELGWPVISGDGSKVLTFTTEKAFASDPGVPWKPGDPPSGPLALYLIAVDGGSPPKKIPLPDGVETWKVSPWDKRPPLSISDDGTKASIEIQVNGRSQVYYYDDTSGTLKLASFNAAGQPASEHCEEAMISADGKSIVFASYAKDLNVPTPSRFKEIYRYDTESGKLEMVTKDASGKPFEFWCESPSINGDGSLVSFLADTEVVPGTLSPVIRGKVRAYKSKRLAIIQTSDQKIIALGGRLRISNSATPAQQP